MKKYSYTLTCILFLYSVLSAQMPLIQVQKASVSPDIMAPPAITPQGTAGKAAAALINDTLRYFFNKHYFRNATTPTSAPPNLSFFTVKSPYQSANLITHMGSVFLNSTLITVRGLQALVIKNPGSPSTNVPFRLYLCNVNTSNIPIFPPIDSVLANVSSTNLGVWRGGVFSVPVNVNSNFAIVAKCTSALPGDTIRVFLNNAATNTSTVPANQQYGEGLGVMRFFNFFQSNTNSFGTGTDYEFVVAPWVSYNVNAGVSVLTPSICSLTQGSFSNVTTPMSLVESRFFNLNKFKPYWAPTNSVMPATDSIYNWTFTGSITPPTTNKNASAIFNMLGNQTANLTVRIKSNNFGNGINFNDLAVGTITVDNGSAPTLFVAGTTTFCSTSFVTTTLTVSGASTFTWVAPYSLSPSIVVTSSTTAVYTVMSENLGCTAVKLVTVSINPPPNVLLLTSQSVVCTSASGGSSVSLSGTPAGGVYSGAHVVGPKFTPTTASGTYNPVYSYTSAASGCSNTATQQIRVVNCNSIDQQTALQNIAVFPNPVSNGRVSISQLYGDYVIEVYSLLGELLSRQVNAYSDVEIDLSERPAGAYFIKVSNSGGQSKTVKIVNLN